MHWIAAHQIYLVLIIFIDGVVMMHLANKHRQDQGGVEPGYRYFWELMKRGEPDGVAATLLTGLAAVSGLLLASLLMAPVERS